NGGQITLGVPAGAIGQETSFYANELSAYPEPERVVAGTVYDFGPAELVFNPAITLTIAYDPNHIPAGYAESQLAIHKLTSGVWELQPSVLTPELDRIDTTVSGLGIYGILVLEE